MSAIIAEQILRDWRNDLISGVFFPLLPLIGIGIIHFGRWKGKKRVWMVLLLDALCAVVLVIGILGLRNTLMDYTYVQRGEYVYDTVTVQRDYDEKDQDDSGTVTMIVKSLTTGEEFDLDFLPVPVRKGDTFRVVYLPNTKIGAAIERLEQRGGSPP